MDHAHKTHLVLSIIFLVKGLFFVGLGVAAIGFTEDSGFLYYLTSADQTLNDSIGGIAFFLSRHVGPVSLTVGLVTLILAVLGIVASTRKGNSVMLIICTIFSYVLLAFEVFVGIVTFVYFTLKDTQDETDQEVTDNGIKTVLGGFAFVTLLMSISFTVLCRQRWMTNKRVEKEATLGRGEGGD